MNRFILRHADFLLLQFFCFTSCWLFAIMNLFILCHAGSSLLQTFFVSHHADSSLLWIFLFYVILTLCYYKHFFHIILTLCFCSSCYFTSYQVFASVTSTFNGIESLYAFSIAFCKIFLANSFCSSFTSSNNSSCTCKIIFPSILFFNSSW